MSDERIKATNAWGLKAWAGEPDNGHADLETELARVDAAYEVSRQNMFKEGARVRKVQKQSNEASLKKGGYVDGRSTYAASDRYAQLVDKTAELKKQRDALRKKLGKAKK